MLNSKLLISVVLPTIGRIDALEKTLQGFSTQNIAKNLFEVIVVDDGPDEATQNCVFLYKDKLQIHYYPRDAIKGVCSARNKGINKAQADLILLSDNDKVPVENFLEQHLLFHEKFKAKEYIMLGLSEIHPDSKKSIFMEVYGDLPYSRIYDPLNVSYYFFMGGNISFKKEFVFKSGMFDEDFKKIGFEDLELGFRLKKKGMKLIYNKEALSFHYHPYSIEDACIQQRNHGYNFGTLTDKLTMQDSKEELRCIGESYGVNGWYYSLKGLLRSYFKKYIFHNKPIIFCLKKWLYTRRSFGPFETFLLPKFLSYYTNLGYQDYLKEHNKRL